ncbi:MAG TPA: histidine phosphatase family protein [Steroidobacteraceae bacterium]|jgi:phosphohistidine phosphatase|nr:histidine phosphatase family protein [Steroidobacteraceae bacterium]
MKRLTLVRHAHAKVQAPPVTDFERPLSRRGKAEAKATALKLLEEGLLPDLLITSPARRTLQTAEILMRELQIPERQLRRDELLYLAAPEAILQVIHTTGPRIEHLMIVGHNPGVSTLAQALAPQARLGEFATAAACTMDFDVRAWPGVSVGSAQNAERKAGAARLFGLLR